MMEKNFLAFDMGATSGRAVLGTFRDGKFSMKEVYRFPNGIIQVQGKYYWDVYSIFGHFKNALASLSKEGVHIDSIGIDTWGVDFGCVASDGTILSLPRAYRDPYTEGIPEEVFNIVPRKELYGMTGIQIMNFNTLFQLYAQQKEGYAPLHHARNILFMPDLLAYMLTGEQVCEYTDASTSQMLNPFTREVNRELLDAVGIPSSLVLPIVQPGTLIGRLLPEVAREAGMEPVPVIAVAGHDTASAIAAVPASDGNFAYLSSGTWSLMGIESPSPVVSEESCSCNFTNEGGIEGTTRFLKNITGMWLLEQCRKVWKARGTEYDYATIERLARENISFTDTVDPDDPSLANPQNMEEAICALLRKDGKRVPENDGQMISCIYHSLVNKYKEVTATLGHFASFKIEKLHVIGGGSANDLMSQLTADALGIPVVAGPVEATAIGNIMVQAKACGLLKDRWEIRRTVADAFSVKTFLPSGNNCCTGCCCK